MSSAHAILSTACLFVASAVAHAADPDLIDRGEEIYDAKCLVCHRLEPGVHRIGPSLAGMFDRQAGTADGFRRYSPGLISSGIIWDDDVLDAYLLEPGAVIDGNRMIFLGLHDPEDRAAVIAYLRAELE